MDDRFNTIAGWVLFAGIVALGVLDCGRRICSIESGQRRWVIQSLAFQEEGEGAAAAEQPIEVYLATADPAKGQQTFNKCMACHNADKGGANQLGPNLWGVLGEADWTGQGLRIFQTLWRRRAAPGTGTISASG